MNVMYSEKIRARFWSKVEKTEGCWNWIAGKTSRGYGTFCIDGKMESPHRISLEIHLGRPITAGLQAAHSPVLCHNRLCVNPTHLREATRQENMLDRRLDGTAISPTGKNNLVPRLFTEEHIRAIRLDTRSQREIANEYHTLQPTISAIKVRKTYAWVTD
jgi:hypothetical protein